MQEALKEAKKAFDHDEIPIGAVIVKDNEVIAKAYNQKEQLSDPTAHAEILAIREAGKRLQNWRLDGCELYVTVEPCPMCLSAITQTNIKKLVYGSYEPRFGAVESHQRISEFPLYNKDLEVISGVLEDESSKLLNKFFNNKRKQN